MSLNAPPLNQNETSLQPFNLLPQELLLPIFQAFDPIKRSLLLKICRNWHDFLLSHRSLWNSLVLSDQWSFEESLSILKLFNSRSGHQLKHVCLDTEVTDDEGFTKVFEELGKSSDSLRVLSLVSELSGDALMRLAKKSCPKLNTLHMQRSIDFRPISVSPMFSRRQRLGIIDAEDEKLKYLRCTDFYSFGEEEPDRLDQLSVLKGLCFRGCSSLKDMSTMLMASRSTLTELDLLLWFPTPVPLLTSRKAKPRLKNLQILDLPMLPGALSSLKEMVEVEGKLDRLGGFLNRLVEFSYPAVKHLTLRLYTEEVQMHVQELEHLEQSAALFKEHHSIEELTLWCPNTKTGGKKHLDFLLKTLLSSRSEVEIDFESLVLNEEEGRPDSQEEKEVSSSSQQEDHQPEIPLPNLVKLTVRDPVDLNGNLLWKLWKSWKNVRDDFTVLIRDDEGEVEVNDWEARGWTD